MGERQELDAGALARSARRYAESRGLLPDWLGPRLRRPVFAIGFGRSGTTLLERILGSHPQVARFPGEANDLWHPHVYPWREAEIEVPPPWLDPAGYTRASLASLTKRDRRLIRRTFGRFQQLAPGDVFVQKSALTTFMVPFIRELFPDARFVHIYRDGRAAAFSYARKQLAKIEEFPRPYGKLGVGLDFDALLDSMAAAWNDHMLEVEARRPELGRRMHEFSYEQLCARPAETLGDLAGFLGVDAARFPEGTMHRPDDRNYKYAEGLSDETVARITCIMREGLLLKGYLHAAEGEA